MRNQNYETKASLLRLCAAVCVCLLCAGVMSFVPVHASAPASTPVMITRKPSLSVTPPPTEVPPVFVPVYYVTENGSVVARTEVMLRESGEVKADPVVIPEEYEPAGETVCYVQVKDGAAEPAIVEFMVQRKTITAPVPAQVPAPPSTPTPKPATPKPTATKSTKTPSPAPQPVSIVVQPLNAYIFPGCFEEKFTVEAVGSNLAYQWQYKSGDNGSWTDADMFNGAKTNTLTVRADEKNYTRVREYKFRCKITDALGNIVYSETAEFEKWGQIMMRDNNWRQRFYYSGSAWGVNGLITVLVEFKMAGEYIGRIESINLANDYPDDTIVSRVTVEHVLLYSFIHQYAPLISSDYPNILTEATVTKNAIIKAINIAYAAMMKDHDKE